jgi:hypothetical protein
MNIHPAPEPESVLIGIERSTANARRLPDKYLIICDDICADGEEPCGLAVRSLSAGEKFDAVE